MITFRGDLWLLCDYLEAELEGRPHDSSKVHALACYLGDNIPGISQSMQQIRDRYQESSPSISPPSHSDGP
jgi:hypothetical protein